MSVVVAPSVHSRTSLHRSSRTQAVAVMASNPSRNLSRCLRHAAVIGAASSLNPGEGFDLVAPHVPTPLLAQIDQLPFTFQHTLLEQSEGFARVEILRTA